MGNLESAVGFCTLATRYESLGGFLGGEEEEEATCGSVMKCQCPLVSEEWRGVSLRNIHLC